MALTAALLPGLVAGYFSAGRLRHRIDAEYTRIAVLGISGASAGVELIPRRHRSFSSATFPPNPRPAKSILVTSSFEQRRWCRGGVVLRLATIVVVVLVLVAGAGYYALRTVMAPDWIRANVVPALESAYGRRVLFEGFRLRPRSIALTGVRVLEVPEFAAEGPTFLYVDRVEIGFDPFGLLRRAFIVEFVRFVRPQLHLHENETGLWNVQSLFGLEPIEGGGLPAPTARNFRLVITRVEVQDATVRVRRAPTPARPGAVEAIARNLQASVMFHPMTGFLDYETRASIELPNRQPASLAALGALDLAGPQVAFEIAVDGLDFDALEEFAVGTTPAAASLDIDELVEADVDHELLLVATNVRFRGVPLGRARIDVSASRAGIEVSQVELAAFGGKVHGSGRVDLTEIPPTTSLSASVHDLDIAALASAFGREDIGTALPGRVSGSLSVIGSGSTQDEILASALGATNDREAADGVGAALELKLGDVDLAVLSGVLPARAADGSIESSGLGSTTIDLRATAKRIVNDGAFELRDVVLDARLAAGTLGVRRLEGVIWGGDLLLAGDIDFSSAEPGWTAAVSLSRARYEDLIPDAPNWAWSATAGSVDATLDVVGRGLTVEAFLRALRTQDAIGRAPASIDGRISIAVEALDLDLLGKPPRVRDDFGPLDLGDVDLDLDVSAKRVRLWKLDYADVTAKGTLERNAIAVERITGTISQGTLELAGDVDFGLEGFAYAGHGAFRDVETGLFATTYLPPDVGQISGRGSASFEFELGGTMAQSALDSLRLDGYVALHSGRVHKSKLLDEIAKATGVREFDKPELTRSGGDVHISNRRLTTQRLVVGGSDARVFLVGGIGFDASLDVQIWLGFSPDTKRQMFSRGIFLPYITDDKGWTYVPFVARGDVRNPDIETTPEAVRSTAMRVIPDATERIVRESSRLLPGGETIVGGSIDAVKSILGGLGRVLQANSARAKGDVPLDSRPRDAKPSPPHAPANYRDDPDD